MFSACQCIFFPYFHSTFLHLLQLLMLFLKQGYKFCKERQKTSTFATLWFTHPEPTISFWLEPHQMLQLYTKYLEEAKAASRRTCFCSQVDGFRLTGLTESKQCLFSSQGFLKETQSPSDAGDKFHWSQYRVSHTGLGSA